MMNDFYIAISIRCDYKDFVELLDKANIKYRNIREEKVKYYYDELTFCVFDIDVSRQEFYDKINNFSKIKQEINEINFIKKEN